MVRSWLKGREADRRMTGDERKASFVDMSPVVNYDILYYDSLQGIIFENPV